MNELNARAIPQLLYDWLESIGCRRIKFYRGKWHNDPTEYSEGDIGLKWHDDNMSNPWKISVSSGGAFSNGVCIGSSATAVGGSGGSGMYVGTGAITTGSCGGAGGAGGTITISAGSSQIRITEEVSCHFRFIYKDRYCGINIRLDLSIGDHGFSVFYPLLGREFFNSGIDSPDFFSDIEGILNLSVDCLVDGVER